MTRSVCSSRCLWVCKHESAPCASIPPQVTEPCDLSTVKANGPLRVSWGAQALQLLKQQLLLQLLLLEQRPELLPELLLFAAGTD
jgi:hypothetical protein